MAPGRDALSGEGDVLGRRALAATQPLVVRLDENTRVGRVRDGVQDALEVGRLSVERVANQFGVLKTLVEIGVLEVIDQLVMHAFVGQGGKEHGENQGPEAEGDEEPKAQAPLTH